MTPLRNLYRVNFAKLIQKLETKKPLTEISRRTGISEPNLSNIKARCSEPLYSNGTALMVLYREVFPCELKGCSNQSRKQSQPTGANDVEISSA